MLITTSVCSPSLQPTAFLGSNARVQSQPKVRWTRWW